MASRKAIAHRRRRFDEGWSSCSEGCRLRVLCPLEIMFDIPAFAVAWRVAIPVPPTGKYFRCYLLFTRTSCNRPATDSGSSRERPRDVSPHPHSHVSRANGDAISRLVRSKGPQSSATGVEGHGALPLVVATCTMAAATSKMRAAPTAAAERARGDHCRAQRPLLGSVGAHTPPQHRPVPASEVVPPRTLCYARGNARTRSEVFIPCMCRRL